MLLLKYEISSFNVLNHLRNILGLAFSPDGLDKSEPQQKGWCAMRKPISIGQSHNLVSILANNAGWDELDSDVVQKIIDDPQGSGRQFTAFLKNGAKLVVGLPAILTVDRTKPFDPTFVGNGWTIDEQDERSLALAELDLTKVRFETMLKDGETRITGEEKLKRLKEAEFVRLDARIFQTFWENQYLIPESWKEKVNGNIRYIFFDGTVLRSPGGYRYVLFLAWNGGQWRWDYGWLGSDWAVSGPSAALASV